MKESYIYILSNINRTVFYTGVTANLVNRMKWHLKGMGSSFCSKYNVNELIYYELFMDIREAIKREKEIKGWRREKKVSTDQKQEPGNEEFIEEGGLEGQTGPPPAFGGIGMTALV
jgi:putative endonuclease